MRVSNTFGSLRVVCLGMTGLSVLVLSLACGGAGMPAPAALDAVFARGVLPPAEYRAAWFGVATRAAEADTYWIPTHETAEVAIFVWGEWDDVPEGVIFSAISAAGPVELTYVGVREISYGCDGNTAKVALFDAETAVEGIVWLHEEGKSLESWGVERGDCFMDSCSWTTGPLLAKTVRASPTMAKFSVTRGSSTLFESENVKHYMDGAEETPINLEGSNEIGMPYPELTVADGEQSWLVFRSHGYEGTGWTVVDLNTGEPAGMTSAYFCAF